ncbi:MAG: Hint domain-containing protein [Patescibacteria group bacterium]|nr:Hint domain-containing protein [Patescibacteria group bacterium]
MDNSNIPSTIMKDGNSRSFKKKILLALLLPFVIAGISLAALSVSNRGSSFDIRNRAAEPSSTPYLPLLTKVNISPGGLFYTYIGNSPTQLSALAYDQKNNPIWSGVTYDWGISSSQSIGSLSRTTNSDITSFTPQNDGIGDLFVTARYQDTSVTASVKAAIGSDYIYPSPGSINICGNKPSNTACIINGSTGVCENGFCTLHLFPDCATRPFGDANCDSQVNDSDFNLWQEDYYNNKQYGPADFNNDGVTDLIDFEIWRRNNGTQIQITSVPPPLPTNTPIPTSTPTNDTPTPTPIAATATPSLTPTPVNGSSANCCTDSQLSAGYQCIQDCGPPVARIGDPTPASSCLDPAQIASRQQYGCPRCLAENTDISTPQGEINVKDIKTGMVVWSVDSKGEKISVPVIAINSIPAVKNQKIYRLDLSDRRILYISASHPTILGIPVSQLKEGQIYDGAKIVKKDFIPYNGSKTYDLLPDSDTGYYYANGILVGSTLFQNR